MVSLTYNELHKCYIHHERVEISLTAERRKRSRLVPILPCLNFQKDHLLRFCDKTSSVYNYLLDKEGFDAMFIRIPSLYIVCQNYSKKPVTVKPCNIITFFSHFLLNFFNLKKMGVISSCHLWIPSDRTCRICYSACLFESIFLISSLLRS